VRQRGLSGFVGTSETEGRVRRMSMRAATKSRMTRCRRNPCFFTGSRRLLPQTVDATGHVKPAIVSQPVKLASMEAGCAGVMPAGDR